jgi:predicted amidophosphoribosyltransferase
MLASFFVKDLILDILYPPTCIECEADDAWLCEACLQAMPLHKIEGDVVSLGYYAHPTTRKLLTHLKYRSATCLVESLRAFVRRFRGEHIGAWPWAGELSLTLCGVPSDEKRVRERGIDHVSYLLDIVQVELVPWASRGECLIRKRHIAQNAALPANELRKANVQGIFEATSKVSGAVLLIDDVYTTGATWEEAARTLCAAGASKVYGLVFAKG